MKFRRRRYITNTALQIRVTFLFVFVSLLGSIAAAAAFNFFALKELEAFRWSTHLNAKTTDEIIGHLFLYVSIADFLFVSMLIIISGIWMIRKISGPLYRMSNDIRRVADGDLSSNIALRQGDEFKDTALELNNMVKSIRDRFNAINNKFQNISKVITEFKYKSRDTSTSIENYNSVLRDIENLESELNTFTIRQEK